MTRILLMEDDDVFRSALRVTLEGAGYAVAEAPDGAAGLRLFHQLGADLVLVDIFMPEMDGFEVIRALRTQVPPPHIIAMSGGGAAGQSDVLAIAATLGAARTLRKPFTPSELVDALRDLLGSP